MKILYKSLLSRKIELNIFALILFLSLTVIQVFFYYSLGNNINIKTNNEKTYGKYDISVITDNEEDINDIIQLDGITDFEEFSINLIQDAYDNNVSMVKASERYCDFYGYEIYMGSFPHESYEILCEPWYLYKLGYNENQMLGAHLLIDNQEYIVSGLISSNGYKNYTVPTILTVSNVTANGVILCIESDELQSFEKKLVNNFSANIETNDQKHLSDESNDKEILIILFVKILVTNLVTLHNVIKCTIDDCRYNISVLRCIGIRNLAITRAYLVIFIIYSTVIILLSNIISTLYFKYIILKRLEINYSYNFINLALYDIITICLIVVISLVAINKALNKSPLEYATEKGTYFKSMKFHKNLHHKIAYIHIRTHKLQFLFASICLVISIVLIITVNYYSMELTNKALFYGDDIDYVVALASSEDLDANELTNVNEKIESLRGEENVNKIDLVYQTICKYEVKKDSIPKAYKKYLEKNMYYKLILDNQFKENICIPILIVGYSDEKIASLYEKLGATENMNIQDDECLYFSHPIGLSDKSKPVLIGNTVQLYMLSDVYIKATYNYFPDKIVGNNVMNIMVVNKKTYENITGNLLPSEIYVETNQDNNFEYTFIDDSNFNVLNVKKLYTEYQKSQKTSNAIRIIMVLCLTTSLTVSIIVILFLFAKIYRKDYCILKALGCSEKILSRISWYEIKVLMIPSAILGIILSIFMTSKLFSEYSSEQYIHYQIPNKLIICSIMGIILMMIICQMVICRYRNKDDLISLVNDS